MHEDANPPSLGVAFLLRFSLNVRTYIKIKSHTKFVQCLFLLKMHRVISSGRKKRFLLAAYNRFTKERTQALVQTEAKISELRSQLNEKGTQLEDLKTKLHKTEERIRRRKRKFCIN